MPSRWAVSCASTLQDRRSSRQAGRQAGSGRTRLRGQVPGEAVHARPVTRRGLPEYEVPGRVRVQVIHGDAHHAAGPGGPPVSQQGQQVAGQQLAPPGPAVDAHRDAGDRRYGQHRDLQREEGSRETGQQIQRRLLPGIKGAERLQVKDTPRRSRAGRAPGQERRERLAGLGVAG